MLMAGRQTFTELQEARRRINVLETETAASMGAAAELQDAQTELHTLRAQLAQADALAKKAVGLFEARLTAAENERDELAAQARSHLIQKTL